MAEWLRTGLQIRLRRFDSGSGLHKLSAALAQSVEHIIRNDGVTGSNPVSGTILSEGISETPGGKAFQQGAGLGPT